MSDHNLSEIRKAVRLLTLPGHVYELRCPKSEKGTISGYFDDPEALASTALSLSGQAPAVYFTLNPVLPDLLARSNNRHKYRAESTTADVEVVRRHRLLIDADPTRPAGISSSDAEHDAAIERVVTVRDFLTAEGCPLPLTGDSSNGGHLVYGVDLPNDAESTDLIVKFLAALKRFDDDKVKVDQTVFNAARISKIYGTMSKKGDNTTARPHRVSRIIEAPERLDPIPVELLRKIASSATTTTTTTTPPSNKKDGNRQDASKKADRPGPHTAATVEKLMSDQEIPFPTPSAWKDGLLWELEECPFADAHTNGSRGEAAVTLVAGWIGFKCQHSHCADKKAADVFGPEVNGGRKRTRADGRPQIIANGRQLRDVTADAIRAIHDTNAPPTWFSRGGKIVRKSPGRADAEPAKLDTVRNLLSQAADWFKVTAKGDMNPVYPPEDVARDVLASDPELPSLAGIIRTPVFAPGGRLIASPGYDTATGLYLDSELKITIPDNPTAAEVQSAKELLLDVLHDFPFVGAADRAHAVALLLLPFVRPMISGPTPIHLIDAPSEGTGKGLLADVIAVITTGAKAEGTPEPRDDAEWSKVITAALMAAPPVVFFDNIKRPINSAALASATTSATYKDRVLGRSEMVELPVRNVWLMTGNNVHSSREIARRFVRIRMDSGVENPNLRTDFKHKNLIRHVTGNRAELVRACLTIVRGWVNAGSKRGPESIGSYEDWAGVMGGILAMAGITGLLTNQSDTMSEVNQSDNENKMLVNLWATVFGDKVVTAAELYKEIVTANVLFSFLSNASSPTIKLGFHLANIKDRVFGQYRIERAVNPAHNSAAYRLAAVVRPGVDPKYPKLPEVQNTTSGCENAVNPSVFGDLPEVPEVTPTPEGKKILNSISGVNIQTAGGLPQTSGTSGDCRKTHKKQGFTQPEVANQPSGTSGDCRAVQPDKLSVVGVEVAETYTISSMNNHNIPHAIEPWGSGYRLLFDKSWIKTLNQKQRKDILGFTWNPDGFPVDDPADGEKVLNCIARRVAMAAAP